MNFGDAVGEGFFNYANFGGRAARAEYWWWALFAAAVVLVAYVLDLLVFGGWSIAPFLLVCWLALLLPGLSVTVRRLHDTGRSGWWILIPTGLAFLASALTIGGVTLSPQETPPTGLLLVIGLSMIICIGSSILLLVWMCLPSVPGNNEYGPNRYAGGG